jgi:phage/plasmid-like protein (TIGR03299 family)
VYRSDTKEVLNLCNSSWTPIQNSEAFSFFDELLESGLVTLDNALCLFEGKRIAITCKVVSGVADVIKNDTVQMYIVLFNGHDGTLSLGLMYTPIRVICNNTLTMAINKATKENKIIRLRHSANIRQNLELVQSSLNASVDMFRQGVLEYQAMQRVPMSLPEFRQYAEVSLQSELKDGLNNYRHYGRLVENFENGIGSDIPGVSGTLWQGYQALTQLISHQLGEKKDDTKNTKQSYLSRANSLLFGKGSLLTQSAHDNALKLTR